jgi:phospholipase C
MSARAALARTATAAATAAALALAPAGAAAAAAAPQARTPIKHLVVLMQANHSFDSYFGTYPGADGLPPGTCVPKSLARGASRADCVRPFRLGDKPAEHLPISSWSVAHAQLDGGRLDGFVTAARSGGGAGVNPDVMGHYDGRDIPYAWNVAGDYVLFDRFFTSSLGGKLSNRMFWVAGAPGVDPAAPVERIPSGGFSIPTIFDRLEAKGISWKFYVENYDPAITYRSRQAGDRGGQIVRVPLLDYPRFVDDPKLFGKIVDAREYYRDLERGTLPAVSFFASSASSEHPPGSVPAGQAFIRTLVDSAMRSSAWPSTAFLWTYDDWGGFYDHVRPPRVDRSGFGFRAPALLVSPYARRGYVDHTTLDFTSILKFIEQNWGLRPLASRDRRAQSIAGAFDFSQPPRPAAFVGAERGARPAAQPRRWVVYACYLGGVGLTAALLLVAAGRGGFGRGRAGRAAPLARDGGAER